MRNATLTPLARAEDFFRKRSLFFHGATFDSPLSRLIEGEVWDLADSRGNNFRKLGEMVVCSDGSRGHRLLFRINGWGLLERGRSLAVGLGLILKQEIRIDVAGDELVYLPLVKDREREIVAREEKKAERAFLLMLLFAALILALLIGFFGFAVPALKEHSEKIAIGLIFARIAIWFGFRM